MKYSGFFYRIFLVWFCFLLMPSFYLFEVSGLSINDINETYSILKPEKSYCSPLFGALWWEKGVVKKYYLFGNFFQDGAGENETKIAESGDNTNRLIHQLFHFVQGSFGITNNASYPAYYFTPALVGKIVGVLENERKSDVEVLKKALSKAVEEDVDFNRLLGEKATIRKQLESEIKTKTKTKIKPSKEVDQLSKKLTELKTLFKEFSLVLDDEGIPSYEKALASLSKLSDEKKDVLPPKKLKFIAKTADEFKRLKSNAQAYEHYRKQQKSREKELENLSKQLAENNPSKAKERLPELLDVLIGSLKECNFFDLKEDKKTLYPDYTTHMLLLAFLYRKAEKRSDLQSYFTALKDQSLQEMLVAEKLSDQIYQDDDYIEFNKYIAGNLTADHICGLIGAQYEVFVYSQIVSQCYRQIFPSVAEYRTTLYRDNKLPDCMETTIRNACNIICYDLKNGTFFADLKKDFSLEEDKFNDEPKRLSLEDFYAREKNNLNTSVSNPSVHLDWTRVVQNLPYVAYINHCKHKETLLARESLDKEEHGYVWDMKIPDGAQVTSFEGYKKVTYNGKTYRLVDPEKYYLFELVPCLKNFIIILNKLLDLNLYEESSLEKEFWRADFNAFYFPKLCEKIGWEADVRDFDQNDYSPYTTVTFIKVLKDNVAFNLNLSRGHGFLTTQNRLSSGNLYREILQKLLFSAENFEKLKTIERQNLLVLSAEYLSDEQLKRVISMPIYGNYFLYLQDLLSESKRHRLLLEILRVGNSLFHEALIARLITSFPVNQDLYYQIVFLRHLAHYNKPHEHSMKIKQSLDSVVRMIQKSEHVALNRFSTTVAQYFDEALNCDLIKSQDLLKYLKAWLNEIDDVDISKMTGTLVITRATLLNFFKRLIEKNEAEIIEQIFEYAQSKQGTHRFDLFKLILNYAGDAFFEKVYAQVLEDNKKSFDEGSKLYWIKGVLETFDLAIKKNKPLNNLDRIFDAAGRALMKYASAQGSYHAHFGQNLVRQIRQLAIVILKRIIERGEHVTGSYKIDTLVRVLLEGDNPEEKEAGFDLMQGFIKGESKSQEKSVMLARIVEEGLKGFQQENEFVRKNAFNILESLIQNNVALKEIAELVKTIIEKGKFRDYQLVLQLFFDLVKKAVFSRAEVNALIKNIVDRDDQILLTLLIDFIKRSGSYFDSYQDVAKSALENKDPSLWQSGLGLIKVLLNYDRKGEELFNIASSNIETKDLDKRQQLLQFFIDVVFHNGRGFQAGFKAAERCLDGDSYFLQQLSFKFFEVLIKKGQLVDQVIPLVIRYVQSDKSWIRQVAIGLLYDIIKRGYESKDIIQLITQVMDVETFDRQQELMLLFERLVRQDVGFKEALFIAQKGIKSKNESIKQAALDLFNLLLKKGIGKKEAFREGIVAMDNSSFQLQERILQLFTASVEKEEGYDQAFEAVKKGLESKSLYLQKKAIELMSVLAEKGYRSEEIGDLVYHGIMSQDSWKQRSFLEVFKILISKKAFYRSALQAFNELISDGSEFKRLTAFDLLDALLKEFLHEVDRRDLKESKIAFEVVKKGLNQSDDDSLVLKTKALEVLRGLILHLKADDCDAVFELVEKEIARQDYPKHVIASLTILSALVEKSDFKGIKKIYDFKDIEKVAEIIQKFVDHENVGIKRAAIQLTTSLVMRRDFKDLDLALKVARIEDKRMIGWVDIKTSLDLWRGLVSHSSFEDLDEATRAAQNAIRHTDDFVKAAGLYLFTALAARKDYKNSKVLYEAAYVGLKHSDSLVKRLALEICRGLVGDSEVQEEIRALLERALSQAEQYGQEEFSQEIKKIIEKK